MSPDLGRPKNSAAKLAREDLFWHYPHYHGSGHRPAGAIRWGNYKLIEFFEDISVEMYNLANDPSERRDLAAVEPAKAQELRKALHNWRRDVDAARPNIKYHAKRLPDYDVRESEIGFLTLQIDAEATWDHIAHSPNASTEKARRLLGYEPRYSSLEAVQESVDWLVGRGLLD